MSEMVVKISELTSNNPPGKLADAELHFTDGPLAGLKLIGFSVWERRGGNGRNVTFPARSYTINGERRSFALLRPIADVTQQERIRTLILDAYAAQYDAPPAAAPSPLESSADAAGEWSIDAAIAERAARNGPDF